MGLKTENNEMTDKPACLLGIRRMKRAPADGPIFLFNLPPKQRLNRSGLFVLTTREILMLMLLPLRERVL